MIKKVVLREQMLVEFPILQALSFQTWHEYHLGWIGCCHSGPSVCIFAGYLVEGTSYDCFGVVQRWGTWQLVDSCRFTGRNKPEAFKDIHGGDWCVRSRDFFLGGKVPEMEEIFFVLRNDVNIVSFSDVSPEIGLFNSVPIKIVMEPEHEPSKSWIRSVLYEEFLGSHVCFPMFFNRACFFVQLARCSARKGFRFVKQSCTIGMAVPTHGLSNPPKIGRIWPPSVAWNINR